MGLLDGGISKIFGAAFGGLYLPATLHRATTSFDEGGTKTTTYEDVPCKVQVDDATYAMKQAAGYVAGDVRVIILAASLSGEVTTDDQLSVPARSARYSLAGLSRDPAASQWIARGSEV